MLKKLSLALMVVFSMTLMAPVSNAATSTNSVSVKTLGKGTSWATKLYIIDSRKAGPTVLITGGVHGNETAGYTAANKVTNFKITRGKLLVIPEVNRQAIQRHSRTDAHKVDLNRQFPTSASQKAKTPLARAVYNVMKQYHPSWTMDMHEGFDYFTNSKTSSVGESIIAQPTRQGYAFAKTLRNKLNANITTSSKKFTLLRYPVKGSLARCAGEVFNANSMIVETVSKQPLKQRVNYQVTAAHALLAHLNMQ